MAQSQRQSFKFLPLSLMVETQGGVSTPLVLRGTPLPAKRSETFTTADDNQTSVEVTLYVGERTLTVGNKRLGVVKVNGIPAAPRGEKAVKVTFSVDTYCAVTVTATVEGTDVAAEKTFRPPADFDTSAIADILADAAANREADEAKLQMIEATNRAKRIIARAEAQLAQRPAPDLDKALAALGIALDSGDSEQIRARADIADQELSKAADPFGNTYGDLFGMFFGSNGPQPGRTGPVAPQKASHAASPVSAPKPRASQQPDLKLSTETRSPSLGKVFGGGEFTADTQLCFVLMPFNEKFRSVYEGPIRSSVAKVGLRCERADEIHGVQMITWDIWERINRARVLIAELTDRNSNVFYELGLAHALSKDVLLLTQSMDHVPFDLKGIRCIVYDPAPSGLADLSEKLEATLSSVMQSG
ncbi:MAG: Hsp70 family protein [Coriobacteriales bacterium]